MLLQLLLLLLPRSICNILVACHVAKGNAAKAESPISATHSLTHSLIHSVVYSDTHATFIHTNSRRRSHECIAIVEEAEAVWGVSGNMFVRMWKINEKIVNKSAKAEIKHGSLTHTDTHTHVCKDTPLAAYTDRVRQACTVQRRPRLRHILLSPEQWAHFSAQFMSFNENERKRKADRKRERWEKET